MSARVTALWLLGLAALNSYRCFGRFAMSPLGLAKALAAELPPGPHLGPFWARHLLLVGLELCLFAGWARLGRLALSAVEPEAPSGPEAAGLGAALAGL